MKDRKTCSNTLYRYAGGKTRVKKDIIKFIFSVNPSLEKIVSPFFGGGSIEIQLASMGVNVAGYDIFEPLTDFWHYVQEPEKQKELYKILHQQFPLNPAGNENLKDITPEEKDRRKGINSQNYKNYLPLLESDDRFERAWGFYMAIKGSYSGKIGCSTFLSREEFRLVGLEKVRDFYNPNLTVKSGNCFDVIPQNNNEFLYLDPPYYDTISHYYGKKGELHKSFDHEKLREVLEKHKGGFVMSYDNSKEVRKMYKDMADFKLLDITYQMSGTKRQKKKELLIYKKSQVDHVVAKNRQFENIVKVLDL